MNAQRHRRWNAGTPARPPVTTLTSRSARPGDRGTRLALWIAVMLALAAPCGVGAADVCGDADGDGGVTVADGIQALRAAAQLPSTCVPARCDIDGGGAMTVADGVSVLRASAGLSVVLACPGSSPGPTPTPGPGATPTPSGACTALTATLTIATSATLGAARLVLDYPESSVTLPGSGAAAAQRLTVLGGATLLGNGRPNDRDDRVLVSLVAPNGVASGDVLAFRFDCVGAAPSAAAFSCALERAVGTDGVTAISQPQCTVRVASEP
jgi:hypothetical protein